MDRRVFQKNLENFREFLVKKGYPNETIITEYAIGDRFNKIVDLAIVDPSDNNPIALFSITDKLERIKYEYDYLHGIKALREIPKFIVLVEKDSDKFKIFKTYNSVDATHLISGRGLEELKIEESEIKDIPSFNEILTKARLAYINKKKENRDFTYWVFALISWILASILTALLVLVFKGCIEVTITELTLIGIIIGLILIPFSSKLKIMGIEIERKIKRAAKK